jgi:hypothetical protein
LTWNSEDLWRKTIFTASAVTGGISAKIMKYWAGIIDETPLRCSLMLRNTDLAEGAQKAGEL